MAKGKSTKEKLTLEHPPDVQPEDWLRFIELPGFTKAWKKLGLNNEDLKGLSLAIMVSPEAPPVVPGTGGLRKCRFAPSRWHVGKSNAARVCYAYFADFSVVVLVSVYRKSRKADLSQAERNEIKGLLNRVKAALEHAPRGRKDHDRRSGSDTRARDH